jgi:hypothetical protein
VSTSRNGCSATQHENRRECHGVTVVFDAIVVAAGWRMFGAKLDALREEIGAARGTRCPLILAARRRISVT